MEMDVKFSVGETLLVCVGSYIYVEKITFTTNNRDGSIIIITYSKEYGNNQVYKYKNNSLCLFAPTGVTINAWRKGEQE